MIGYIYHIICEPTGKHYIGITEDIKRRFKKHRTELNNNTHHSPKLQNAWNYYGANAFAFSFREVEINEYADLSPLEIAEIAKYDSYNNGYNCTPGGISPTEWRQKVKNEDIVTFLCINYVYGDGYGKTMEEIFGWAKGTASAAKTRKRFIDANASFDKLSEQEKKEKAYKAFRELDIQKTAMKRQLAQGGCEAAYKIGKEELFFAFAAKDLHYGYSCTAKLINIKPATVKDWFNGRARKKEYNEYLALTQEEKEEYYQKVKSSNIDSLQNDREKLLRNRAIGCV